MASGTIENRLASFQQVVVENFSHNGDTWTAPASGLVVIRSQEAGVTGTWYAYLTRNSSIRGSMAGTNGTGGLAYTTTVPVDKGVEYSLVIGGITSVAVYFTPIFNY